MTRNEQKFAEAQAIADDFGRRLVHHDARPLEIQSEDVDDIVRAKALDAYQMLGRPLFVEHTSLHLAWLNGFPAGLTSAFILSLGDDKICELFGGDDRSDATGRTTVGFHDGRKVTLFHGEIRGRIVMQPAGPAGPWGRFGWNRVFAPAGGTRTFSELGVDEKNQISMRRAALRELFKATATP